MKSENLIKAFDGIVLVGSLFVLLFLIGYSQPLIIAPMDNLETSENVLFSIEKADRILIDTNLDFSNPRIFNVSDGLEINLEPGQYFWKAEGIGGFKTEVRNLTVLSRVDLRLRETLKGYEVENAGNVNLNVDVYNQNDYSYSFKLETSETSEVEGDKFVGGWND